MFGATELGKSAFEICHPPTLNELARIENCLHGPALFRPEDRAGNRDQLGAAEVWAGRASTTVIGRPVYRPVASSF